MADVRTREVWEVVRRTRRQWRGFGLCLGLYFLALFSLRFILKADNLVGG